MRLSGREWRSVALGSVAFMLGGFAAGNGDLAAAWPPVAHILGLTSTPVPVSANVLSEHESEQLDGMSPQDQATLLLERSINHYAGANEQIAARAEGWRGSITLNDRLNHLFMTAINSNDLSVRIAGIEVDIAARDIEKSVDSVDRLEATARHGEQGPRVNAMWDLALIGNRGVAPERVLGILSEAIHDQNDNIRYWAVEGLAYLASDEGLALLLDVFHDDPSPSIRERAACGLAQSGMFSAAQRRTVVPTLLQFASDGGLDDVTRGWVFQALRDITGQTLPRDAQAWRDWYRLQRP